MDALSLEQRLLELIAARDFDAAATAALEAYGDELYGFLIHLMSGEPDAAEVFAQTTEDLWRGLPSFAGRCSVRTWLYLLARHAASRFRRSPWNRGLRSGDEHLDALAAQIRTRTQPWLRSDVKDRWHQLRESLEPDDRTLLVLRVDRDLAWNEVAQVMLGSEEPGAEALSREAARLRKRFQHLKEELREKAREAGLLDS